MSGGVTMQYGTIAGVGKRVSRLVMGCDNQQTSEHAAEMFDDFTARGGNCFDTAHIYGGGLQERLLGEWVAARGVREDVVIIGKGAHTPHCDPEHLTSQLLESLQRLGTEYVDIYLLHRDNLEVPVGEFVDCLDEHVRAGRVRAWGGSNWTLARVAEANAYAQLHGRVEMGAVSNNFSLARMLDPVWAGCIAASDPESKAWLTRTQLPLLPWSSQARGFFTERAGRDKLEDEELVRCWYDEVNFARRDRAIELAKRRGVEPINIALAYVLAQPFPTFPLVGPRTVGETESCCRALEVGLTEEEVRWLEGEQ